MKEWVKDKLEQVEELYTPERISKSKSRWERIWNGEKSLDRYPFVYSSITFNYYDDVRTPENLLRSFLDEFIIRGRVEDDFIPSFFPGCRQATIPNMFGAKEIVKGNDHACERIIYTLEDIDRLPEPSIESGTLANEWLQMQQYLLEETEGRIPVHVVDMQGPLDVCGQLWGYDNILAAPYEEPEYYHKLMTKSKDAFILFWKKQKDLLGDNFVGTHLFGWDWVPKNVGASMSADVMSMLSPSFFDQYYRQYIEEIGTTFGGLSVHSCGDFKAVVKNLCAIPCLKAVNAGQMTIKELLDAGLDTTKIVIAYMDISSAKHTFDLIKTNSILPDLTITGLWPQENQKVLNPQNWGTQEWELIRQREWEILEIASV